MTLEPLPIDAVLEELLAALDRCGAAVLTSPPGTGKTTRVPAALVDHGVPGEVWVLQPRRIAARAAARRVAFERGGSVGGEVGYQVRHDRRVSESTRIRFVTEGILVRHLLRDPFLPGVGAVVLDEFHERSLEADLTLAMLAEIRNTVREDLRVLVMSATLEASPIVEFLAPCEAVVAAGRLHDVTVEHRPVTGELAAAVCEGVRAALDATPGDVLVFLPGAGEIGRCQDALRDTGQRRGVAVLPLHGRLPAEVQDAAIVSGSTRKVVLATNVAETSITIEGVTAVVDSGFARILRHDTSRGLDRLELSRISRASAEQRRGRAGRTGPGVCYRLWSLAEDRGLVPFEMPEIRRLDLAGLALHVRAFAARDPRAFGFFEAPEPAALDTADDLLRLLGAIDEDGLTELGQAMLHHPVHPRLARMLEEGRRRGCLWAAAEFAALLSEREIVSRGRGGGDLFDRRDRLREVEAAGFAESAGRRAGVDVRAARAVAKARDQLVGGSIEDRDPVPADLVKTLLAGYPDRVSGRKSAQVAEGVMATGRGFRLTMSDHENLGELLLALQVRESGDRTKSRSIVDLACALEESWLEDVFPGSIHEQTAAEFHGGRGSVSAVHRRSFGRLVLETRRGGTVDADQVAALFATELRRDPWRHLGEQKELRGFLARVAWLRREWPEAELPELTDTDVAAAAVSLCPGLKRLAAIADAPVLDVLVRGLPRGVREQLRRHAPERIILPSGRGARIDYDSGPEPFVAARMQEFFGLKDTPVLAGGKVPLLLHLLAPNQRPVQITRDLASFWVNVYPGVRKELQRRYPKHSWPEDPLAASAESRPRRRR